MKKETHNDIVVCECRWMHSDFNILIKDGVIQFRCTNCDDVFIIKKIRR